MGRMRGNSPKIDGSRRTIRQTDAVMSAFDNLPRPVREALAKAVHDLDPVELRSVARDRNWNGDQMVAAVKWLDERITSRSHHQRQ